MFIIDRLRWLGRMLPEITKHDFDAALEDVSSEVLSKADVLRPPIDAFAVAAMLGIDVAHDRRQPGRARFVRLGGGVPRSKAGVGTIFLRPEPRRERRQWAVAHEIGERWAHHVFATLGVDPQESPPHARERVANLLAGRLLLPKAWFATDAAECGWDLFRLKSIYKTASHELIARRMLDFSTPIIISIFDQGRLSMRRSNVTGHVPSPTKMERDCWQHAHRQGCPHQVFIALSEIRAWPIHEPNWKREILRTSAEAFTESSESGSTCSSIP